MVSVILPLLSARSKRVEKILRVSQQFFIPTHPEKERSFRGHPAPFRYRFFASPIHPPFFYVVREKPLLHPPNGGCNNGFSRTTYYYGEGSVRSPKNLYL